MGEDLTITIGAKADAFKAELDKIRGKTKNLEANLAKIAKVSALAFVGLSGVIAGVVVQFAKFDNSMRGVKTLLDQNSFGAKGLEKGFAQMQKEMLNVGRTIPVSIDALSKSLFDTVSAGIDASKAIKVVAVAGKLAVAGLTDVSTATDGMTSALNAYGLAAEDADIIAAKFFTAQKFGKTTIQEISKSFGLVGSTAAAFGVSLDELLAATAAATTGGIKTEAAFTGLKAVLANIAKPTADAKIEAERLGIEFNLAALKAKGFKGFLDQINASGKANVNTLTNLFGSVEAVNIALALTGNQADTFNKILIELEDTEKSLATFNAAFAVQNASLSNQFTIFTNKVKVLAIQIGAKLAPAVTKVLSFLNKLFDLMQDPVFVSFAATVLVATTGLAGFSAAAAISAIVLIKVQIALAAVGVTMSVVKIAAIGLASATGIGLLIVALGFLVANFDFVKAAALGTFAAISVVVKEFAKGASAIFKNLGDLITGVFTFDKEKRKSGFAGLKESLSTTFSEAGSKAAEAFNTAFDESIGEKDGQKKEDDPTGGDEAGGESDVDKIKIAGQEAADAKKEVTQAELDALIIAKENERRVLAEQRELTKEEEKEFLELDKEEKKEEAELRLEELKESLVSDQDIRDQLAREERAKDLKKKKQQRKDDLRHRTALQKISDFFKSDEVKKTVFFFDTLSGLMESGNATLFKIGQAAAIAQTVVRGLESAFAAFSNLFPIPFVGPALATAAFAAVTIRTAQSVSKIASAKPGKAQAGGLVPGGGIGDTQPFLLEAGEFITPKRNASQVIDAVAAQKAREEAEDDVGGFGGGSQGSVTVEIVLNENAAEIIEARLIERESLGISDRSA